MLSVTMAGLNAAQKEMNVTSNNLANASTVGFKRSYANFGDVFSSDPAANPKTSVGSGVLTSSIARDTTAGALKTTGRVTDMAIDGRGFFVLDDGAGGLTYSRAGNFSFDELGNVVDPGGFQACVILPPATTPTPLKIEPIKTVSSVEYTLQGLSISSDGTVSATYSNNEKYDLGRIALATFPNDGGLKAIGGNRYVETGLSGANKTTAAGAPNAGNIMSGALEQANVDITNELMDMIRAQQVYNGNARMLQTTVETVSRITDKL
jgi:flagellar hook protein FlgE